MKKLLMMLVFGLFAFQSAFSAQTPAKDLDQLLKLVEQGKAQEAKDNQRREREFARARDQQAAMLKKVKAQRVREEARGTRLEKQFDANELKVADMKDALNKRLGSLKELFGVLQQVSGDARANFQNSLTSVQFPDREKFLTAFAKKMGTSSELASISEMEHLWFELQREMTESGKVSRFNTRVIAANGQEASREVVRVGAFNLASAGKYLSYEPETGKVSELSPQPQSRFVDTTTDLLKTKSGLVTFGLDPTRGQILSLLVQAPSIQERIKQGGLVGYLIIALGIVGLLLAIERMISLGAVGGKVKRQLASSQASNDNPLGRVLMVFEQNRHVDLENLELKLGEAMLREVPILTRYLTFLKIIAVVAPLMGLLGTVTGMINTFQQITLFGTGDPKLMAGGISMALVTTVLGLVVAIPTVLLHTIVSSKSKGIIHILQEQSAGMIAEQTERQSSQGT